MRKHRDRRVRLGRAPEYVDPPDFQKRTPAVADTKAGAKEYGNRETSVNLNSTSHQFDAIVHYQAKAAAYSLFALAEPDFELWQALKASGAIRQQQAIRVGRITRGRVLREAGGTGR